VTGEEVAEREVVLATLQVERLCEEVPTSEFFGAGLAVGAVAGDRLLGGGPGNQADVEVVEDDLAGQLSDIHTQAAREQGTGGVGGVAVANKRGRFHENIKLDGGHREFLASEALLGSSGASETLALFLVLAVITVGVDEVVHGEGQAAFGRTSTVWSAMTGEGLLRTGGMGDDFIDGGS
jgi:hypothetical protein